MSRVLPYNAKQWEIPLLMNERRTVARLICKDGNEYTVPDMSFYDEKKRTYAVHNYANREHTEKLSLVERKCPVCPGDILYVRETWTNDKLLFGKHVVSNYHYKADADGNMKVLDNVGREVDFKWKPSIHMPKEAARIWLKVTDVRVERLQEITEDQAIKEGISRLYDDLPDDEYEDWAKRTGIYPKQKIEWGYKNYLWHGNFGNCGTGNWKSDRWDYQYSSYENAVGSFSSLWNSTIKKPDLDRYGWDANPYVFVIEFSRCEKPKGELCEEN